MKFITVAVFVAILGTSTAFSLIPSFLKQSDKPINASETYIADVYQYFVDLIGRVSKQHDFDALWAETKPQIQKELKEWKRGRHSSNGYTQAVYRVENGAVVVKLIDEFLGKVLATNPGVVTQIENESNEKIHGFDEVKRIMSY